MNTPLIQGQEIHGTPTLVRNKTVSFLNGRVERQYFSHSRVAGQGSVRKLGLWDSFPVIWRRNQIFYFGRFAIDKPSRRFWRRITGDAVSTQNIWKCDTEWNLINHLNRIKTDRNPCVINCIFIRILYRKNFWKLEIPDKGVDGSSLLAREQ